MSKDITNYQCRGCFAIGNQCNTCPVCRKAIRRHYEGLLKLASRAEVASPADILAYCADALGMRLADLKATLGAAEANGNVN